MNGPYFGPCTTIRQYRDRDQDRQNDADAELEAARREADSFSFGLKRELFNTRLQGSKQMTNSVTARGLHFDADQAMRDENEEGAIINHIYEIVANAGKRETEEGGEVQLYEAELAYIESGLRPPNTLTAK